MASPFHFNIPFEGTSFKSSISRAMTPTWASNLEPGAAPLRGRTRFVGMEVSSSNVLTGLATLAGASRMAAMIPVTRATEWRDLILEETPVGAEFRTQPKRYDLKFEPDVSIDVNRGGASSTINKKATKEITRQMVETVERMRSKDYETESVNDDIKKVAEYCRQLNIDYESAGDFVSRAMKQGGEAKNQGEGRLQSSIKHKIEIKQGFSSVTMYSDSYYAWFVEEGYLDVLQPVSPYDRSQDSKVVALVPLDQMGQGGSHYDYLKGFSTQLAQTAFYGPSVRRAEAQSSAAEMGTQGSEEDLTPMVKLKRRDGNGISRPGHFMFLKGTNRFMANFEGIFAQEISKLVELAEIHDIRYDSQVRQFRGKTGRGNRGSFVAGAIAQAAASSA